MRAFQEHRWNMTQLWKKKNLKCVSITGYYNRREHSTCLASGGGPRSLVFYLPRADFISHSALSDIDSYHFLSLFLLLLYRFRFQIDPSVSQSKLQQGQGIISPSNFSALSGIHAGHNRPRNYRSREKY